MGVIVSEPAEPQAVWSVVQTDGGLVTLVPVESLQARIGQLNEWIAQALASSAALHGQADDHFAASAAILVPRSKEWSVPAALASDLGRASTLAAAITTNDATAADLKEQKSHGNVFGRIGAWRHERGLAQERGQEATELRALLIEIGRAAPPSTVPEADGEIHAATDLQSQATELDRQIETIKNSASGLTEEVGRRQESIRSMGFDALYEAASLQTSGAAPVDSPLLLKAGEAAYLAVPATLARMVTRTQHVGGSSGFSFPIGHTGIRYRVGSFRGQPVQQQSLKHLDAGTFVLSNQRVAFIGRIKSSSIPLAKILHVEVYDDAIAVFKEGRENPDFYLMEQPKRAVFLLNWIVGGQSIPGQKPASRG